MFKTQPHNVSALLSSLLPERMTFVPSCIYKDLFLDLLLYWRYIGKHSLSSTQPLAMSLTIGNSDSYGYYGDVHGISGILRNSVLDSSYVDFLPGGCLLSNGYHDCHIACRNITQVMGSWETLNNCLAYPRITQAMLTDNLAYDDLSIPRMGDYGIAASDNTTDIVSSIQHCFLDYCLGTEKDCNQKSNTAFSACYGDSYINANSTEGCFVDICKNSPSYLNPDVGGIGVSVGTMYSISRH